ncbi:MAG TPA: metallopeptidase family protein [Candidatus Paceibacterota bacterium]|jgi:predicted Zn-dependent protease with MMP-like domain|nr:metallopeptidase family protein [Candidatus Paceibacterota bacterium]
MSEEEFIQIAEGEWARIPERFRARVKNVALLVEDDVDDEIRAQEGLEKGESLLGLYQGIPLTERGSEYGVGMTLPDTITLYRLPILEEAEEMDRAFRDAVRIVIRETIWHEVGHYFGLDEHGINEREGDETNRFEC